MLSIHTRYSGRVDRSQRVQTQAVARCCPYVSFYHQVSAVPCSAPGTSTSRSGVFSTVDFPRQSRSVSVASASQSSNGPADDDIVRVAAVGDIVSVHFVLRDEDGKVLEASQENLGEPLTFEVGSGEMMGNRLFMGFDEAVRGMAVGQTTVLEASGGEYNRDLLFSVPRDHPEIQRLEGRYKNQGGLAPGLVVELANGAMAMVLEMDDTGVKLDANNMLAGRKFLMELTLVGVEKPGEDAGEAAPAVSSSAASP